MIKILQSQQPQLVVKVSGRVNYHLVSVWHSSFVATSGEPCTGSWERIVDWSLDRLPLALIHLLWQGCSLRPQGPFYLHAFLCL